MICLTFAPLWPPKLLGWLFASQRTQNRNIPPMKVTKLAQLTGHNAAIFALVEGQDERHLLTGAGDGWVVQWNLDEPDPGKLLARVEAQVFSLFFLKNSPKIIAGDMHGGVHWIDLDDPTSTKNSAHHQRGVFGIKAIGGHIFTIGGEGKLSKWNIAAMQPIESYQLSNQALRCFDFDENRQEMAIGGSDGNIYVLDAETLEIRNILNAAHASSVFSVAYSPDGKYLLSGGRDAMLCVWDLENGFAKISSQPAHWYTINSIDFSPDGRFFASGSRDKTLKIWDAKTLELLKVLEGGRDGGHFNSVNKVFWSKHQQILASCSDDRTVILWKIEA